MIFDDRPEWLLWWLSRNGDLLHKHTGASHEHLKNWLGCGSFGCVVKTGDPRWVVKITADQSEGDLVKIVLDARAKEPGRRSTPGHSEGSGPSTILPGIVFYRSVFISEDRIRLERTPDKVPVHVIVREVVNPKPEEIDRSIPIGMRKDGQYSYLSQARNAAERYYHSMTRAGQARLAGEQEDERAERVEAKENLSEHARLAKKLSREWPEIGSAMMAFKKLGIPLKDAHQHNVGESTVDWGDGFRPPGTMVIFDLGATPTGGSDAKFPLLNPGARR